MAFHESDLDGSRRLGVSNVHYVVKVVGKSAEKIKEKFTTSFHFHLHSSGAFECLATADDKSEVMSAKSRICVRGVYIAISCALQNNADLNSTLQTLLPKRQALELLEAVLLSGAVDDTIFEKILAYARDIACGFDRSATTSIFWVRGSHSIFEFPRVSALAEEQFGVVVTLVEVLEDGGDDFGFFVGKFNSLALGIEKFASACNREKWRQTEDIFVRCEQSTLSTNNQSDNW